MFSYAGSLPGLLENGCPHGEVSVGDAVTLGCVRNTSSNKLGFNVFFRIKIISKYVAIKIIKLDFRELILVVAPMMG